jgi:hypothetical protein
MLVNLLTNFLRSFQIHKGTTNDIGTLIFENFKIRPIKLMYYVDKISSLLFTKINTTIRKIAKIMYKTLKRVVQTFKSVLVTFSIN